MVIDIPAVTAEPGPLQWQRNIRIEITTVNLAELFDEDDD